MWSSLESLNKFKKLYEGLDVNCEKSFVKLSRKDKPDRLLSQLVKTKIFLESGEQ